MAGGVLSPETAGWVAGAAILWPLVLSLAGWIPAARRVVVLLAPWAVVPALILVVRGHEPWVVEIPWPLPGTRIGVDHAGFVFLLLAAVTWLLAGASAAASMSHDPRRARFFTFFLLSMSGSLGLTLARDAVTFYACSALMSLSAYGLVVHDGHDQARRAGRAYLAFAVLGEALLAAGLFLAVRAAGTTNLDVLPTRVILDRAVLPATTLILLACGIKAGAVPLHVWLPASYTAAPLPATVALAGTMSKAAILGVLRFVPLGYLSFDKQGAPVVLLGVLGIFYGVAAGLPQRHPKTALAYVSVSQAGFIATAIGMGIVTSAGWAALLPAVLVYVLHHGLATGALFFTLDVISPGASAARSADSPIRTAALVALAVLGLSLAGLPLTSGAEATAMVKDAVARTELPAARGVVSMLTLAAAATTLLMARVVWLALAPRTARATGVPGPGPSRPAIWIGLAAASLSLAAPWTLLRGLADPAGSRSTGGTLYIALGLALAGLAAWRAARARQP